MLLPQHEKLIRDSAISREVAEARGYRSVEDPITLRGLGFERKQARVPGLLIPVFGVRGAVVLHQFRPDVPRTRKRQGRVREIKYETPAGAMMRIDVPPAVRPRVGDPDTRLLVTEGIRKADSAISHGLDCLGLLGIWNWRGGNGRGGKTALPDWEDVALERRRVVIAFDSDIMQRPETRSALARLWLFLSRRGADVWACYLPEGDDGRKVGLDDYFAAGGTAEDLLSPRYLEHELRPIATAGNRPRVSVAIGDLHRLTEETWKAIGEANDPPALFRHGGTIARVERDEYGAPAARTVEYTIMRRESVRLVEFYRPDDEDGDSPARPPRDLVENLLAWPEPALPVLVRVVNVPVFAPDGSFLVDPGYHPAARVYFDAAGLVVPAVPERPTAKDVEAARQLLLEDFLGDFPFATGTDRAHVLALLLLGYVRDMIDGPTPLHLIEKPSPGTGAGLLTDVLSIVATGRPAAVLTEGRDEDEMRKRVTAALQTGAGIVFLDNLRRRLDSAALSSALTTTIWTDRQLGRTHILRIPVRCAWVCAGNNPGVSTEIARRVVPIRLDAKVDRPWERTGFRHPELGRWTRENRPALVHACLVIVRAWIAGGRPRLQGRRLGSFEDWAETLGGIVQAAGLRGFLGNLATFYDRADREGEAWRAFVFAWWEKFHGVEVGVKDLLPVAAEVSLNLGDGNDRSQQTRLGQRLQEARDRRFGALQIEFTRKDHSAARFRLVETGDGPDPSKSCRNTRDGGEPHGPDEPFTRATREKENRDEEIIDERTRGKGSPGSVGSPTRDPGDGSEDGEWEYLT